ncbi:MAG: family 20 glycosylhydrolase [Victivallales bacterium]|nr:family 20 glycosylhydrolase [Victivallales bacterium]
MQPALKCLIPRPAEVTLAEGEFSFKRPLKVSGLLPAVRARLEFFGAQLSDHAKTAISFKKDKTLPAEGFAIVVTPDAIHVTAGDDAGQFYGEGALEQLLWAAFAEGADVARMQCGSVRDYPRYPMRGLMIDSARHFQSKPVILSLLDMMAKLRLNHLHWHLTDGEGWRFPCLGAPKLNTLDGRQAGCFAAAEIAEITAYAQDRFIQIIPELDMPGHSWGLTHLYPELACDPAHPGNELCLGNPKTMNFMLQRLDEMLALFPESKFIHIGGDEAGTGHWEKCPKCQAKIKELGLTNERKLEEWFMNSVSRHVLSAGRTPVSWNTAAVMPEGHLLQAWGDVGEMMRLAWEGRPNPVLSSLYIPFYMDYPQHSDEPHYHWMTVQTEEMMYDGEPAAHMEEKIGSRLKGVEAPLWTEMVPEWRVRAKFLPRAIAIAEVGWTQRDLRDYQDYRRRRFFLESAGYTWWI